MHSRIRLAGAVVLIGGLSLSFTACGQYSINNIRALKAFKDANDLYKKNEFKAAATGYEEALDRNPDFFGITYFFLGNSYDNLYKPAKAGDPENDAYLQKAVENYKLATEKIKDTDPQGAADQEAGLRVPDLHLQRQDARPGQSRAGRQAAHPDGAERAGEL